MTTFPTHARLADGVHVVTEIEHHPTGDRHTHRVSLACGIKVDAMETHFTEHADDGKPAKAHALTADHAALQQRHQDAEAKLAEALARTLAREAPQRKKRVAAYERLCAEAEALDAKTKLAELATAEVVSRFPEDAHPDSALLDEHDAAQEAVETAKVDAAAAWARAVAFEPPPETHESQLPFYAWASAIRREYAQANHEHAKTRPAPKRWLTGAKATCPACASAESPISSSWNGEVYHSTFGAAPAEVDPAKDGVGAKLEG